MRILLPGCILLLCSTLATAQASSQLQSSLASGWYKKYADRTTEMMLKLKNQTNKYLTKIECRERKIYERLKRKDSVKARQIFGDVNTKYKQFRSLLGDSSLLFDKLSAYYNPTLDSIHTAINFSSMPVSDLGQLANVNKELNDLQQYLTNSEKLKKLLSQRVTGLSEQLPALGFVNQINKLRKDAIYYKAQLTYYQQLLSEPDRLTSKALSLLRSNGLFKKFFDQYSFIAPFLPPPVDQAIPATSTLQTPSMVNAIALQTTGARLPIVPPAEVSQLQGQLDALQSRIKSLAAKDNTEEAKSYKPNSQKVKTFWKRIEVGTNLQSAKPNGYFPTTTDLGLSVGYKINDKGAFGLGASYKVGWGSSIRSIELSSQGLGLRSYFDYQLKKIFYFTAGLEYNRQILSEPLPDGIKYQPWLRSGLAGLSAIMPAKGGVLKKAKLQLLYDFFSRQQLPVTSPFKFRVGYALN